MNIFKKAYMTVADWTVITIGKIHWGYKDGLTEDELAKIRKMLKPNYYIILTHRDNHLSTWFVGLASWVVTGKWSYWAHALMNLEDEVKSDDDFRLIEATGAGTHYSSFEDVFKVHGVVLLKPKNMTLKKWTAAMDKAKTSLGKPYDSLFDLKNDQRVSCVELVRSALMATEDYETNFANFEAMIKSQKNLTPEMFYNCPDFEIAYEVRHLKRADSE
jgi:hypothetical protein